MTALATASTTVLAETALAKTASATASTKIASVTASATASATTCVDLTELNHNKLKLDRLTGRKDIEENWTNSDDIDTEKKNQYRLCYNHLLYTCLYVG